MATVFEVYAVHPDERYAAQAAQAAFDLVDRLERELSRFRSNSDIARVNHLAAGESARLGSVGDGVPPHRAPSVRPDGRRVRHRDWHRADVARTGCRRLLGPRDRDGVRLDLGGIGKGYAVDLVAELLEDWGIERALVHGGFSSVLALEASGGDGWPLTLERSGGAVTGARSALGAPDGPRSLRRAQGRSHRGPSHRRARPRPAGGLGRAAAAGPNRRLRRLPTRGPGSRPAP